MNSVFATLLSVDPAASSAPVDRLPDPSGYAGTLLSIDQTLTYLAIVLVILSAARWIARSGCNDPLRSAPPRPNVLREDTVLLVMVVYLTAYMVFSFLLGLGSQDQASAASLMPATGGAQLAGIAACLMLAGRRFTGGTAGFLMGSPSPPPRLVISCVAASVLAALGLCPMLLEMTMRVMLWFDPQRAFPVHSVIESLRDAAQPAWVGVGLWIGTAVLAPVAEELFFRGLVQTVILNMTHRRWLAIVMSSTAFALVHLSQPQALPALFFLAVLLGFVYERTGSLLPVVIIHAMFNLKTLIWEALLHGAT